MNSEYLIDIIILLSAAILIVPIFQFLGVGAISGFLVAGIALGPSGLGYIQDYDEIARFAELGVIFLLFVIGIEINPSRFWKMRKFVLGLGTLQVLITGGLITVITHLLLGVNWELSLLIGLALALSSTAFVLQLLTERKALSSKYGKPALAVLLLQDLAVVPLLAFVSFLNNPDLSIFEDVLFALGEAVVILILIIAVARYILNPILNILARFGSPEIFTASALLLVLGSAQAMELIGLSMAMGAFIAGLLIADSLYRHEIMAEVLPFRGLLLGLFFMSMGMSLNISVFLDNVEWFLGATLALIAIKFFTLWPLAKAFGVKKKPAMSVALLLAQSGEFALILFALAKSIGLLEEALFQQLLILVLLSMFATPLLDYLANRVFISSIKNKGIVSQNITAKKQSEQPAILAGYGRMGHRIGHILELMNIRYVAIDIDPDVVTRERLNGKPVYCGDVQQLDVLKGFGAENAPFVIVSIDDVEVAELVVSSLHTQFPEVPIFARGHDLATCRDLKVKGAHFTASETLEASAELARKALLHNGAEEPEVNIVLNQFRKDYYGRIKQGAYDKE